MLPVGEIEIIFMTAIFHWEFRALHGRVIEMLFHRKDQWQSYIAAKLQA